MRVRQSKRLVVGGVLGLSSLLVVSPAYAIGPVSAAASTETIQGQYVRIVSVADWEATSGMYPGQQVQWDLTVSVNAPEPGTVTLGISASGGAALAIDVALCMQAWTPNGCPDGASALKSDWDIPRDGDEVALTKFASNETAYLRLMVGPTAGGEQGATELRLHAHGVGENVFVGPGGGLAVTGMSPLGPWILGGGAGLVVLGLVLIAVRRWCFASQGEEGAP